VIDVLRCIGKSTLSLQVNAGRGDSLAVRIEDSDLITVVVLAVKRQFVSVMDITWSSSFQSDTSTNATAYHDPPLPSFTPILLLY